MSVCANVIVVFAAYILGTKTLKRSGLVGFYRVTTWFAVMETFCAKDEKCLLSKECVFACVGGGMLVSVGRFFCVCLQTLNFLLFS